MVTKRETVVAVLVSAGIFAISLTPIAALASPAVAPAMLVAGSLAAILAIAIGLGD